MGSRTMKQMLVLGATAAVTCTRTSSATAAFSAHDVPLSSHHFRQHHRKRPRPHTATTALQLADGAWSYGTGSEFLWGGSFSKTPISPKPPAKRSLSSIERNTKAEGGVKRKGKSSTSKRGKSNSGSSTGGTGASAAAAIYRPYGSVIEVLRAYHSIHGDLVIPRRFVVPESSDFPAEWYGIDLASTVYDLRWWKVHVKSNSDRVEELNKLGFVWERLQPEWNLILEALMTYYTLQGNNVMVPATFVVPYGDHSWPKATWGIPLGNCVNRIRTRGDYLSGPNAMSRRQQLDGLGFVFDCREYAFLRVYRALKHYRKLEKAKAKGTAREYRILRIPSTYVVPSGEESGWPEDLWGLQLGAKCAAIRHKDLYVKNHPERKEALENLGFRWSGNATLGWLEVIHAAAIYSRLHDRQLDVPINFIVPAPPYASSASTIDAELSFSSSQPSLYPDDEEWPWPEHLWGLSLGQRLKDIRLKGAYLKGKTASSRRAQLDALGFNWSPKRGRPRKKKASKKEF